MATIGKSGRLPHSGEGEVGARVKHTQDVKLCNSTAVRCPRYSCKELLVGGSPPPPRPHHTQTTALQHPGFPGRPACSRIKGETSCALWVRVVVSLGAGGEREVVR